MRVFPTSGKKLKGDVSRLLEELYGGGAMECLAESAFSAVVALIAYIYAR